MKFLAYFLIALLGLSVTAQQVDYVTTIQEHQNELNEQFRNPDESPLESRDRRRFEALDFYPIDEKYKVVAQVRLTPDAEPFDMPTTIPRKVMYQKYADLIFELEGNEYTLEVYQNLGLVEDEEYADYLFLPFSDLTSGDGSYGGGRYINLRIPEEGETIEIDFNKAYNPYCAYSARYSCPIVPRVNRLLTRIEAGVMDWGEH